MAQAHVRTPGKGQTETGSQHLLICWFTSYCLIYINFCLCIFIYMICLCITKGKPFVLYFLGPLTALSLFLACP